LRHLHLRGLQDPDTRQEPVPLLAVELALALELARHAALDGLELGLPLSPQLLDEAPLLAGRQAVGLRAHGREGRLVLRVDRVGLAPVAPDEGLELGLESADGPLAHVARLPLERLLLARPLLRNRELPVLRDLLRGLVLDLPLAAPGVVARKPLLLLNQAVDQRQLPLQGVLVLGPLCAELRGRPASCARLS